MSVKSIIVPIEGCELAGVDHLNVDFADLKPGQEIVIKVKNCGCHLEVTCVYPEDEV